MQKRGFASAILGSGAIVLIAASAIAIAQTAPSSVRVTFVDRDAGVIFLNNGDAVTAPAGFNLASLVVGMAVTVTYDNAGNAPFAATALATATTAPAAAAPAAAADPAPDALMAELIAEGRTVYGRNCSPCHGAEGQGQPPGQGAAPPLAGSTFLSADLFVVRQVLYGAGAYMPAFSNFTDRQVAAVVTYARNSFGNSFGVLTEAAVAANR